MINLKKSVLELLKQGKKNDAIRVVRTELGWDIRKAMEYVDDLIASIK